MNRIIKEEFYDIDFRKKIYSSINDLQTDLDTWIHKYNHSKPYSEKFCYGETLMQTFKDSKHLAIKKHMVPSDSSTYMTETA